MVKTITMTALLFLAGVGAVLWLMPYEWLWIVLPAVTLLLCAVSVALYWYEVRLPIGRMIASMQAMREGQAVTLDDARRDDEFGEPGPDHSGRGSHQRGPLSAQPPRREKPKTIPSVPTC